MALGYPDPATGIVEHGRLRAQQPGAVPGVDQPPGRAAPGPDRLAELERPLRQVSPGQPGRLVGRGAPAHLRQRQPVLHQHPVRDLQAGASHHPGRLHPGHPRPSPQHHSDRPPDHRCGRAHLLHPRLRPFGGGSGRPSQPGGDHGGHRRRCLRDHPRWRRHVLPPQRRRGVPDHRPARRQPGHQRLRAQLHARLFRQLDLVFGELPGVPAQRRHLPIPRGRAGAVEPGRDLQPDGGGHRHRGQQRQRAGGGAQRHRRCRRGRDVLLRLHLRRDHGHLRRSGGRPGHGFGRGGRHRVPALPDRLRQPLRPGRQRSADHLLDRGLDDQRLRRLPPGGA